MELIFSFMPSLSISPSLSHTRRSGAFPVGGSLDDVLTLCKSSDHSMLVTGDQNGSLQLRSYPSRKVGRYVQNILMFVNYLLIIYLLKF